MEEQSEELGSPENHEVDYQILGKISLLRHGATKYTDEYPDLTELGQEQAAAQGEKLRETIDPEKEDVLIASSPAVRARGTADIIKQKLEKEDSRVLRGLRGVATKDRTEALKMINEIIGPEGDVKKMDRAYAHDPAFEERVDVWEPRSNVEQRFFRGLDRVSRIFAKYKSQNADKIPHFIGVSHFESLNHFVAEIFKIKGPEADTLNFAEMIEISLLKRPGDPRHIPLLVTYRGMTKEVVFDRETGSLEIARENL